jgi:hypothetical protein
MLIIIIIKEESHSASPRDLHCGVGWSRKSTAETTAAPAYLQPDATANSST